MKYYPVSLHVGGRRCVVIGGGEVALRKAASLIAAGARVVVVSPSVTSELAECVRRGEIEHIERGYRSGDLQGAFLAYAATDDEALHKAIADDAAAAGALLNVVDPPSGVRSLAVARRGDPPSLPPRGGGALLARVRRTHGGRLGPSASGRSMS
jgi:siroheme synthase-like protein